MRKTARIIVRDRDAVLAAVAGLQPATLVVDVEPFVAPWGCSSSAAISGAAELSELLVLATPNLRALVFATNARLTTRHELHEELLHVAFVCSACKPWRITYLAGVPQPLVVLGDQIITDGLLAFRLHAQFLHWQASGRLPWWPRLQAIIGAPLVRFIFSPVRGFDSKKD
jgi:hypothetical protein